ncbi:hypothetical protein [Peribacillus sp. NPDC060253]|uniref:hypothetical protein n=1 Tax=Peribacillus sp. NPDC060253 TaxID=3347084 RepID=UPI003669ED6E
MTNLSVTNGINEYKELLMKEMEMVGGLEKAFNDEKVSFFVLSDSGNDDERKFTFYIDSKWEDMLDIEIEIRHENGLSFYVMNPSALGETGRIEFEDTKSGSAVKVAVMVEHFIENLPSLVRKELLSSAYDEDGRLNEEKLLKLNILAIKETVDEFEQIQTEI